MAKWLGQPYDERFPKNQQTYLDLEIATMEHIIQQLEEGRMEGNTIIDTTGSVVHTSPEICARLEALTTVVYLEATADMQEEMFKLYVAEPKPVVWGDIYQPEVGESQKDTLARCYPHLLAHRSELYAGMSQIAIARETLFGMAGINDFLEHIKGSLPEVSQR